MTRAWPAVPLFLLFISVAVAGLGFWVGNLPVLRQSTSYASLPEADDENDQPELDHSLPSWSDDQVAAFATGILAQSGFSPERQAFSRTLNAPAITEPEYHPRLLGVSGSGNEVSALIKWVPGQSTTSVRVGDTTPWGIVLSIGKGQVIFVQDGVERSIKLFEQ